ncbi:hypothetical protein Ahy_A09g042809 [Arachis hypogaea]|uniref:Uncharacterized protein n=1 Tax=Arachis hypogaea TaxID=3818 RepID=A0A445BGT8_ARAHY|nr:hypothetical protein Ahy_A09g042809 [Arachis hypogaea]
MYDPPVHPVASPSFAVDLNGSGGGKFAAPAGLGDALLDDRDDDDVEPDIIADDSGDDIGLSEPAGAGGSANFTTCLLATRYMQRYNHASTVEPQL